MSPDTRVRETRSLLELFLVSFVGLYTELLLIRWIGTEVRVFAFVQNLALIASFLGFGIGYYRCKKEGSLLRSVFALTALVALVRLPGEQARKLFSNISNLLTLNPDAALWGSEWLHISKATIAMLTVLAICVTAAMLLLIVFAMIPFGQWVGRCLNECRQIETAYSINLLGSLLGSFAIALFAFFWLPPAWWFVFAFLMVAAVDRRKTTVLATIAMLAVTVIMLRTGSSDITIWSPYQKLEIEPFPNQQYQVNVNNTGYMTISNLSQQSLQDDPNLKAVYQDLSYDSPYRFLANKNQVLIVGAGAGNDAAAALRAGAISIDAVEIDPAIYDIGRRLHPEKPYSSPRVNVIIDDARSFFRSSTARYDAIVFGLLDSHTQFSGYTNMRVDNYVYTEQAFRDARRLLKPDGVMILKFEVREPWTWMGRRFRAMLSDVFRRPPVVYRCEQFGAVLSATIFLESNSDTLFQKAKDDPSLAAFLTNHPPKFSFDGEIPPPASDDWPYVYHARRSIPKTYFTVTAILLLLTVFLVRHDLKPAESSTWRFFFLGAGFLLLETQLVSRLALYFGSTWIVNCIAISSVLIVLVFASLFVYARPSLNISHWYLAIISGLLAARFFPIDSLGLPVHTTGCILALLYSAPVFCAGVVFTASLRDESNRSEALGGNLVGAVVGGGLQTLSFIFGLQNLLLVAVALYACSAAISVLYRSRQIFARSASAS
jgi:spermidine synthase